jgi:SAM-dependent methyltransferase
MMGGMSLSGAVDSGSTLLRDNDLQFYRRVWGTVLDVYRTRLRAIRFVEMANVLDAGCGFGQWTLCLSELNDHVCGLDVSAARVKTVESIMQHLSIENVELSRQTIEQTTYAAATFDGIFCYSTLYATNVRRTLREFFRLLKPGGALYICSNGPGWYVQNLIGSRPKARDYSPRRDALRAVRNTVTYALLDRHAPGEEIIIPSRWLANSLEAVGFDGLVVAAEGTICLGKPLPVRQFFPRSYWGLENVYEALAYKKSDV